MTCTRLLTMAAIAAALILPAAAHGSDAWGYEHGTEGWSFIDPDYAACSEGLRQSPIDVIRRDARPGWLPPPIFDYARHVTLDVANLGHTIQGTPADAGNWLHVGGKTYALAQFHFHAPSENFLDGEQYPLEMHLVHRAADGSLAVVGVFFDEGAPNAQLQKVIAATPDLTGEHASAPAFNLASLAPSGPIFRFAGSLTTPPCSEGVAWHVAGTRRTASLAQLAAFAERYAGQAFPGGNRRPIQPLNGRAVLRGY